MGSNYKAIGNYIQLVDERNKGLKVTTLLGLSISKQFIKSVANTIGTDMENYKIIRKNQFACSTMQVRRDRKMPVALFIEVVPAIISQAYPIFEIIDITILLPEYLMMWFTRSEFDREACFHAVGGVRGSLEWEDFCGMKLPIPSLEKQVEIVKEYNTIQNRISLNNQLITKLEETAQAIYKQWFVDFEFPDANGKPYKSNDGEMVFCEELDKEIPVGWEYGELGSLIETINGYAFKSEDFSSNGLYPIIKIKNIKAPYAYIQSDTQYYNSKLSSNLEKVTIQKGDVLISMTGSGANQLNSAVGQVGKYYYNSISLLNQRVCKLQPKEDSFKELIFQFISTKEIQTELLNGSTGSANQANISPSQIKELKLLIPNDNLLKKLEIVASSINNFKSLEMIDKLEELKELLLARMTKVESKMETVEI
jgi:type I restriction enzyme S subunit